MRKFTFRQLALYGLVCLSLRIFSPQLLLHPFRKVFHLKAAHCNWSLRLLSQHSTKFV